ncbi:MAG TPA: hypothetical protein PLV88_03440, partial [Methanoregulaceae archaeon]|nr:hypothetical protein [Methanoregulaceae archaeon]
PIDQGTCGRGLLHGVKSRNPHPDIHSFRKFFKRGPGTIAIPCSPWFWGAIGGIGSSWIP